MPISFTCPHCGASTVVADQYAGQTGPCSKCGQSITIPSAARVGGAQGFSPTESPRGSKLPWIILIGCGGLFVLVIGGSVLLALLLPAMQNARETARRTACLANMRQIALGQLDYETTHRQFAPSASKPNSGKASVSWRTALLPSLEQRALYDLYHSDKSWDDPDNEHLHNVRIELFQCPSDPPAIEHLAKTNVVVVNGPNCIFNHDQVKSRQQIERGDGTAFTLLHVEQSRDPILWLQPLDYDLDEVDKTFGTPNSAVSSKHPLGFNAIYADGHGQFISHEIDPAVLKSLLTVDGGETIDDSKLKPGQ